MNVKEEVNEKIVIKDELPDDDSVTVSLPGMMQYRSIRHQCLKMEHPDSDDDDVMCSCEECTGRVWVQGAEEPGLTVKIEVGDGSMSHPTELNCQPMTADCPDVSLNLPADNLACFFGDDAEESIDNLLNTVTDSEPQGGPQFVPVFPPSGSTLEEPQETNYSQLSGLQMELAAPSLMTSEQAVKVTPLTSNDVKRNSSFYQCATCEMTFTRPSSLIIHKRVHSGEKPFSCSTCGKTFAQIGNCKRHERIHSNGNLYSYTIYGPNFSRNGELKMRQREHSLERSKVNCFDGGVPFTKGIDLKIHQEGNCRQARENAASNSAPLQVNSAGKLNEAIQGDPHFALSPPFTGSSFGYLQGTNYSQMNGKQEKVVPPSSSTSERSGYASGLIGQLASTTKSNKTLFAQVTPRELPGDKMDLSVNQCVICKKTFTTWYTLKGHRRIHSGERPFRCSTCGQTFAHNSNWRRHERTHGNAYICAICGRKFTQNGELQMHQEVHEPERSKATCSACGVSFKRWKDLEAHQKGNCRPARTGSASNLTPFIMNPFVPLLGSFPEAKQKTNGSLPLGFLNYGKINAQPEEVIPSLTATEITSPPGSPDVIPLFVCSTCGKAFVKEFNLKIHTRLHKHKMPYRCSVCGKDFKQKATCNYHQFNTHPLEKGTLRCTECRGAFNWSNLKINHRADCSIVSRKVR